MTNPDSSNGSCYNFDSVDLFCQHTTIQSLLRGDTYLRSSGEGNLLYPLKKKPSAVAFVFCRSCAVEQWWVGVPFLSPPWKVWKGLCPGTHPWKVKSKESSLS